MQCIPAQKSVCKRKKLAYFRANLYSSTSFWFLLIPPWPETTALTFLHNKLCFLVAGTNMRQETAPLWNLFCTCIIRQICSVDFLFFMGSNILHNVQSRGKPALCTKIKLTTFFVFYCSGFIPLILLVHAVFFCFLPLRPKWTINVMAHLRIASQRG